MLKTISLVETAAGHWYKIEDPETNDFIYLPSATNILDAFPNKQLDIWAETTSPEEIKRAKDDGKIQGTKVHHSVDLMLNGEKVELSGITERQIEILGLSDKKLVAYLKQELTEREEKGLIGFQNFWEDFKGITVANEIMVYSGKHGYAGTLDWIGYLWNAKKKAYELWLLDWKTSKQLSRENDLQVAAYHKALEELHGKKFKLRVGILQVGNKNKCKYTLKEVTDEKQAFDLFITTKKLWDDLNPSKEPPISYRQQEFTINTEHKKKGKKLNLNVG